MGTTVYSNTTKAQTIERVLKEDLRWTDPNIKVLKHSLRGECLWYLVHDQTQGQKWIGVALIRKYGAGEYGVKHINEAMGPGFYTCPVSWLKECSPPPSAYAAEWRAKVLAKAQAQSDARERLKQLVNGVQVRYGGATYTLLRPLQRGAWEVKSKGTGQRHYMTSKQLRVAEVLDEQAA